MAVFDTVSKTQAQTHPMDFVNHCLNFEGGDVTFIKLIVPEQPTVEMHEADSVIKVKRNGEEVLVHLEFQTTDSYDPAMSLRMAGYIVRLSELISNIILEETMQQPNIIEYWTEKAAAEAHQQGLEQGLEQGMKERAREDILEALELRLQLDTAHTFKPVLEAIEDSQRLKQLHRAAILAESPEDFQRALASNGE